MKNLEASDPIALVSSSSAVRESCGSWQPFESYVYIQIIFFPWIRMTLKEGEIRGTF